MFIILLRIICVFFFFTLLYDNVVAQENLDQPETETSAMNLGTFSISLAVSDINASISFYKNLGFEVIGGEIKKNWVILKNGKAIIGLFQGMFEENILTFNPEDVRSIQKSLKQKGVEIITEADETTEGPAHMILKDPDGNTILVDQF